MGSEPAPAPARPQQPPAQRRGERAAAGEEGGRGGYPHLSAPPAASRRPWLSGVPRSLRLPPPVSGVRKAYPHPPTPSPCLAHTPARRRPGGGGTEGSRGGERESETERMSTSPSRYRQPSNMAPARHRAHAPRRPAHAPAVPGHAPCRLRARASRPGTGNGEAEAGRQTRASLVGGSQVREAAAGGLAEPAGRRSPLPSGLSLRCGATQQFAGGSSRSARRARTPARTLGSCCED